MGGLALPRVLVPLHHTPSSIGAIGQPANTRNTHVVVSGCCSHWLCLQARLFILAVVQERYEEALPLFEQSLPILEDTMGPRHPDLAISLNNLGFLWKAQVTLTFGAPVRDSQGKVEFLRICLS